MAGLAGTRSGDPSAAGLAAAVARRGGRQVSLSVQRANRAAWRLYERNGFRIVREEQGECILVRDLDCGVEMNGKRK